MRFYNSKRTPKEINIGLDTNYKPAAEEKLREILRRIDLGTYDPWEKRLRALTIDEAMRQYERAKEGVCKPYTIKNLLDVVRSLMGHQKLDGSMLAGAIEARHVQAFIYRRDLSAGTKFGYYNKLKIFFTWLEKQGGVDRIVTAGVPAPPKPRGVPKFLTMQQVDQVLQAIDADYAYKKSINALNHDGELIWLKDFVELAAYTGLRKGEIIELRWGDIRFPVGSEPGYILVQAHDDGEGYTEPKHGSEGMIPMVDRARAVLERLVVTRTSEGPMERVFKGARDGNPVNGNYVSKLFRKYRDLAKVPKVPFHGLRHSFALYCKYLGFNDELTQMLMRHKSIAMVRRYGKLPISMVAGQVVDAFRTLEEKEE